MEHVSNILFVLMHLSLLLVFVVPKFKQIFADLLKGAPLPPLTQSVLAISDAVKSHFLAVLVAGFALGIVLKMFSRTPRGGSSGPSGYCLPRVVTGSRPQGSGGTG